jgi:hypothetical protein
MTVLVDEARWRWRGRLWAHLVSDRSLAELHAFAEGIGLRRVAFQGDHYDVDVEHRERAVAAGAQPVGSRELVRRLRRAGLRLSSAGRPAPWSAAHSGTWPLPDAARTAIAPDLDGLLAALLAVDLPVAEAVVLHRAGEQAVLVRVAGPIDLPVPPGVRVTRDGTDTVLEVHAALSPASLGVA